MYSVSTRLITPAAFSVDRTFCTRTSAHRTELSQACPTPASGHPCSDGETEALAPTLSCLVVAEEILCPLVVSLCREPMEM